MASEQGLSRGERWTLVAGLGTLAAVMVVFGALVFSGVIGTVTPLVILMVAAVVVVVWVIRLIMRRYR
jgi:hypothetical protein